MAELVSGAILEELRKAFQSHGAKHKDAMGQDINNAAISIPHRDRIYRRRERCIVRIMPIAFKSVFSIESRKCFSRENVQETG